MFGYHGRYLRIELPAGRAEAVPFPEDILRRFVGGVGLAAHLLHRECPADRLREMVRADNEARGWGQGGWVPADVVRAVGRGDR
jgi:aldehyde:ferredoxin oxidoreductase